MNAASISGNKKSFPVPRYAWIILSIVYLTGLIAPMTKMKIPPVMPILIDAFNLSYTQAGWLQSFFSISGELLALPAGLIMQKTGMKRSQRGPLFSEEAPFPNLSDLYSRRREK